MFGLASARMFPKNATVFAAIKSSARLSTPVAPIASLLKMRNASLFHSSSISRIGKAFPNPQEVPTLPSSKSVITEETISRMMSAALVPILGVSFLYGPQPINDLLLGIVFPIHAYIGINSSITDYTHKRRYPKLNFLFSWMLNIGTLIALYGCWVINTNDVGLTAFVQKLWNAKSTKHIE
ncbi:Succinate dehydrogenase [ubiquinone] cytochrome b small subunit, mitochondrial [Smittium culicis]|uniref:Succinate dehydrogenase [ubiquinone] cytochrome b small subunit n=1 Tax=Smittium culicis TaxID=133412 RepID=A0A1R1YQY9_9FUNG|nr:Succinate dehydrogenase [ubiquinone] cytochrome b small subunit, mitochondrial [Smittium culicis]